MELELKHLFPYLPFAIKLYYEHTKKIGQVSNIYNIGEGYDNDDIKISIDGGSDEHIWMYKPILKPLEDLEKEVLMDFNFIREPKSGTDVMFYSYEFAQYCFANHYDVFGLIEKKLAIDINKIK